MPFKTSGQLIHLRVHRSCMYAVHCSVAEGNVRFVMVACTVQRIPGAICAASTLALTQLCAVCAAQVKVKLNLHGVVGVDQVQQIEEEEYEETVKKPAPAKVGMHCLVPALATC